MSIDERIYFASRASQEEQLALQCNDPRVRNAHQDFATAYRERINIPETPVALAE